MRDKTIGKQQSGHKAASFRKCHFQPQVRVSEMRLNKTFLLKGLKEAAELCLWTAVVWILTSPKDPCTEGLVPSLGHD